MDDEVRHREVDVPGGLTLHICNQQPSITAVLRAVKRAEHGLFNCVASIVHDYQFVSDVVATFHPLPLLANLRCGLWYAPTPADTSYFKSTDGHSGQWSFSTARINLHVAQLAAEQGGVCIVDATRRGKTFPDALTKTIPIWATVLNRALGQLRPTAAATPSPTPPCASWNTDLHLPPWISKNEKNQIEQRLDGWVSDLLSMGIDLSTLAETMKKPLRCIWISQEEESMEDWEDLADKKEDLDFIPIVLISASIADARRRRRLVLDPEDHNALHAMNTGSIVYSTTIDVIDVMYDYVPGAGDDEESWAKGLTPSLMWAHISELLRAGPDDVATVVKRIVKTANHAQHRTGAGARIAGTEWEVKWIANCLGLGVSSTLSSQKLFIGEAAALSADRIDSIACLNVGVSEPELLKTLFAKSSSSNTNDSSDKSRSILNNNNEGALSISTYKWLPVAGDKAPKLAVLAAAPAAVEFISHHLWTGRKVVVVAEAENIDIAAAVVVACLVACFSLENSTGGSTSNGAVWSRQCKMYPDTTCLAPIVPGDDFSRVTVRQYLAVVSVQYPQVVLSKSLLRQVFNVFLPSSMTAPSADRN